MDTAKAIRTSQFSFDNLSQSIEPAKPKLATKIVNLGSIPISNSEKPRLAPLSGQAKLIVTSFQDKFRWKNVSTLPGLYNEKKTLHPNLRCQVKRPSKISPSSPLTVLAVPTPHSSQLQNRQQDLFETKTKGFRVRTGSSQAKVYTDNSVLRSNPRYNRDSSLQRDISVNSAESVDLNLERIKNNDLARISFTPVANNREGLPLLIIHFEGIIGTCYMQFKEEAKEVNNQKKQEESETLQFFVKKGTKNELKVLSKMFLIVVVFPSIGKKYRKVAKYLLSNKFCIDGIYYNAKEEQTQDLKKVEDYILSYNLILEDFKSREVDRKILILIPLKLSSKIAKAEFLSDGSIDDNNNNIMIKGRSYEEKQFLHFFPKIKANSNHLRVVCVPHFVLSEKNERFMTLLKSSFIGIAKMVTFIHGEMTATTSSGPANEPPNEKRLKLASASSKSLNQIDRKEVQLNVVGSCKEIEDVVLLPESKENNTEKKTSDSVNLFTINLDPLILKLERALEKNKKWKKIKQMTQRFTCNTEHEDNFEFDLPVMKQKIIEGLIEAQKVKGPIKANVMHHFLVGDLFSRNNILFKFYEKDDFYSKRIIEKISGMVKSLKNGFRIEEKHTMIQRRERLGFESLPSKSNTPTSETAKSNEDENESITLMLIKKQAKIMQLYLGE